ncbi:hypothetical protein LCGC14_3037670, partial [marine sediment metagenome]
MPIDNSSFVFIFVEKRTVWSFGKSFIRLTPTGVVADYTREKIVRATDSTGSVLPVPPSSAVLA